MGSSGFSTSTTVCRERFCRLSFFCSFWWHSSQGVPLAFWMVLPIWLIFVSRSVRASWILVSFMSVRFCSVRVLKCWVQFWQFLHVGSVRVGASSFISSWSWFV